MMQLLCDGVLLDLYDNAGLQFTHKNPLFAFDKMECERTTQFKLPCTPTNDRVMALARIPAYVGTGMRQRFAAQLQDGILVKDGYLYVSGYDGKDYTAVFVTGELVGLQAIKNAGKLPEILDYTAVLQIASPSNPSTTKSNAWYQIDYKTNGLVSPSLRAYQVAKDALDAIGVSYTIDADYFRMFKGIPSGVVEQSGSFSRTTVFPSLTDPVPTCATAVMSGAHGLANLFTIQEAGIGGTLVNGGTTYYYKGKVKQFKCLQPITITFPEDWDNDIFFGYFASQPTEYIDILGAFAFLGDRSFNESKVITGDSLRGRSVELATGDMFTFIHYDDWNPNYSGSAGTGQGWFFEGGVLSDLVFSVEGGDLALFDYVREQDQLPEITLVQLLKALATANGKVLYYTDADGVSYDDLNFSTWSVKEIDTLTKRGEVSRTFGDYGQENIIEYQSDEGVLDIERITQDYTIPNVNIKESNTLQTIPFSEGGAEGNRIYVRNPNESDFLADADTTDFYMQRVKLPQNANLQRLCTQSTQFKIECRMSLYDYMQITPKTLLMVDNNKFVWTERSWQKNVAKFTLAKI